MASPELLDRLRAALTAGPELRLAVLFGSEARGTAAKDSDVDVAVLPADTGLSLAAELALGTALEAAAGRHVDLVRLDRANLVLAFRVARDGVALLESAPRAFSRFVAETALAHAELEETAGPARALYLRRLAEGAR